MKKEIVFIKQVLSTLLILTSMTSCSDLLDTKPLGVATVGDLTTGGFEADAFGLYGQLRTTAVSDWTRHWFQSIRSDDAAKGSSTGDAAQAGADLNDFGYSNTIFLNDGNWNDHYKVINACNDLIDAIEVSGLTDSGTIVNMAEARMLRAFLYFDLRRDYGEIPIIDKKIVDPTDGIKPKSSVAEVDAFIEADLEFASENLPLSWVSNFVGRATKGFADGLLAKLYLYQENYAASLAKSEEVIGSGIYALEPSFKTLFSRDGNNSIESIFEIQQFVTESGQNFSNNYYVSQGVRGTGAWDLGWGFNVPTQNLVDAFELNDPRKNETILVSGEDDGGYGSGILPSTPPLDQLYWNKKAYTEASVRTELSQRQNNWENIKILRYADVLLMAAEAAWQTGNTALATDYLNQVRARARSGANVLPDVTATLQAIKHERRIELAMEGERFYDLVRWGDGPAVLGSLGFLPKHEWYPIPQTAIDQSQGVLVQNPNY
ncbi:MAG: RagB/SusD family nutrient uptake outer membrane protein [Flavobacteriales bacterium]|nr:RagB/SusD family nutrient uptake outer membrane protein [Flavobacteriia bacterium]NCP06478.1 RagB/SusD family nutrient uptake outer membrane protein [Flavobacteriales bacterium]PIV93113.1 MAG: RagB/SusD family nutrient uptake outer membrane protein [Flavobacteriaceae bacterium CG17_big_fil_post_rev_8_21_14_2_50_33_15]PIY11536.1 MAG: RagB/SusD family nutrient uptake outer membrane protein [Flavobacteriaceae bacterium CG_4_10_14_3_um_filter_33_47]PJB18843.1 MAG: RagB/SusD family nutrient uptak